MASLDFNGAIANVKTALKNLTTWQTASGTADATAAAARIFEYGVDNSDGTECPCIILTISEGDSEVLTSSPIMSGKMTVHCDMRLAIPTDEQDTYSTQAVWFWAHMSAIIGQLSTSATLDMNSIRIIDQPGRIHPDDNQGRIEWLTVWAVELNVK